MRIGVPFGPRLSNMPELKNFKKILIIGMSGGLAKLTVSLLLKENPKLIIIGVDTRDLNSSKGHTDPLAKKIQFKKVKYTRGQFESLFREHKFDAVFHLGRLSHVQADSSSLSERLDLNVMGTNKILDLCLKHQIKKVMILSTYHVYGVLNDNPVYITEEAPLRASIKYPELRDVVEMDQICTNWMWKHQGQIETVVLRPCSIIGPQISNTMTKYLRTPYAPTPIDFNPMFQFIHEFDMARTVIQALKKFPTGVYNIAPDQTLSIREAKKIVGVPTTPLPLIALAPATKVVKTLWSFPDYLIDYLKFSCIIDNTLARPYLGEEFFRFTPKETLEQIQPE